MNSVARSAVNVESSSIIIIIKFLKKIKLVLHYHFEFFFYFSFSIQCSRLIRSYKLFCIFKFYRTKWIYFSAHKKLFEFYSQVEYSGGKNSGSNEQRGGWHTREKDERVIGDFQVLINCEKKKQNKKISAQKLFKLFPSIIIHMLNPHLLLLKFLANIQKFSRCIHACTCYFFVISVRTPMIIEQKNNIHLKVEYLSFICCIFYFQYTHIHIGCFCCVITNWSNNYVEGALSHFEDTHFFFL